MKKKRDPSMFSQELRCRSGLWETTVLRRFCVLFYIELEHDIFNHKNGQIALEICSRVYAVYLNLYALMNSSILVDTINLGWSIVYIEGLQFIISK